MSRTKEWKHCRDCKHLMYISVPEGEEVVTIGTAGATGVSFSGGDFVRCRHGYWGGFSRLPDLFPSLAEPNGKCVFLEHGLLCADYDTGLADLCCDWCDESAVRRLGSKAVSCEGHFRIASVIFEQIRQGKPLAIQRMDKFMELAYAAV